jgi:putative transposase
MCALGSSTGIPTRARNLAALAAVAAATGTGVAGGQDTPRVSKPRGADQTTRTTRLSPKAGAGRGGQVALPCRTSGSGRREAGDRTQAEALTSLVM